MRVRQNVLAPRMSHDEHAPVHGLGQSLTHTTRCKKQRAGEQTSLVHLYSLLDALKSTQERHKDIATTARDDDNFIRHEGKVKASIALTHREIAIMTFGMKERSKRTSWEQFDVMLRTNQRCNMTGQKATWPWPNPNGP